MRLLHIN